MPQPLPVHPRTGLTAIGFGKRGPIWPVAGGSEDHDDGGAGGQDADGDKGTDSKTGTAGSADKGFPSNTRWQDMTPEQQTAYWMHQSRKHEDTSKKRADYDELKAKADKLDQLEASRKTEAQKLQERADQAEKRAAEAELRMLKREIAEEKGIPLAQADRLRGETREAIEADAEEFAPYVKPQSAKDKQGSGGPNLDHGAGNGNTPKATESAGRALYAERRNQTPTFS